MILAGDAPPSPKGSDTKWGILLLLLAGCASRPIVGQYNGPHGWLRAFASDGCTGSPDGTQQSPTIWAHCCEAHDLKYWAGGSQAERAAADKEMEACVAATGHGDTAKIMHFFVRTFGNPHNETPWRWGFGWTKLRGYDALSKEEREEIERFSPK